MMKRTISLLLALVMLWSLTACGKKEKTAFEKSNEAFDYVTTAYLDANAFSKDIYEAWYMGVNNKFDYNESSEFEDFAAELQVEKHYIEAAVAHLSGKSVFDLAQNKEKRRLSVIGKPSFSVMVLEPNHDSKATFEEIRFV